MLPKLEAPLERLAFTNGLIVLPDRIVTGQALVVAAGRIEGLTAADALPAGMERCDVGGRYIMPGLIDIHTHGAMLHTFNEPTVEAFGAITAENGARGVTSLVATIAAAPIPDLLSCLDFCRRWMGELRPGAQVLGAHLEGPYLNPAQKGALDPHCLRTPDDGSADALLAQRDVLRTMTLAPELPGALALTAHLVELGIVPAAGHSSASDEEVHTAIAAGLRHTVHIWSAQSSTVRRGPWRRPGLLEATLTCDELTAEMIADHKHLPPTLMKLAYKCKGADRLCVISDATSGAGMPEGTHFRMAGMEYEVHDGVGMLFDRTAFAGSTTLLNEMLPVLVDAVGVPLVEAVRMASLTPARVLGIERRKGSLEAGKDADVAILERDFRAWRVMAGGRWICGA